MNVRRGVLPPLLVVAAILALALCAGCTSGSSALTTEWPVAQSEATVAPPAGALREPLTGLPVARHASVTTVPLCVKVTDRPGGSVTGVNAADVVYETAGTGGGGDLNCLYESAVAPQIGPVGPASMVDLWIVPQYRAMLFSTGASGTLAASIDRWPGASDASRGRAALSDEAYDARGKQIYLSGPKALSVATEQGSSITSGSPARLGFSAAITATSAPIVSVTIPLSPRRSVSWVYDSTTKRYLRSAQGKWVTDSAVDQRVSARNVVVMWARYTPLDTVLGADAGSDVTLGGSAQVAVFRDGQRLDGKWKATGDTPPVFISGDGSSILLAPGNTWFEVVPLSANITMR